MNTVAQIVEAKVATKVAMPELIRYNNFSQIIVERFTYFKNIFQQVQIGDVVHIKTKDGDTRMLEVGAKGLGIARNSIIRDGFKLLDGKSEYGLLKLHHAKDAGTDKIMRLYLTNVYGMFAVDREGENQGNCFGPFWKNFNIVDIIVEKSVFEANGTTTKHILPRNLLKGIPDITYYMKSISKLATFEQKVAKDARRFLLVSNSLQLLNYFQEVEAYSNYLRESVGHYFQKTVASRRKVVLDFEADTVSKVNAIKVVNCPVGVKLHVLPKAKKPETPKVVIAKKPVVAKVVNTDVFSKFWKFPVRKNDKTPICKWRDVANHTKTSFNPLKLNTGVPTGSINNLLVVDIDVKDDGLNEFQKYVLEHGIPNTLAVETPSGGFHYYFNYASANPDDEF